MPIPRNTNRPQISLDTGVYGSLPWEGMPDGTGNAQIYYWHQATYGGGQWVAATLQAGVGIDIDFDPDTGALVITNSDYRVLASATADALIVDTNSATFAADGIIQDTLEDTFTGDAELA